jgi:putative hemolysin
MLNSLILILIVVLFVTLGGLFAGAETGVYQLSRLRLRLGVENKRPLFIILEKSLRDSPGLIVSTLLGTNLAHYLATSIVTLLLLAQLKAEHTAELLATALTAPLLFIFSELIPKNLFFYHADSLMPCVSPFLYVSHKIFTWCGLVPLLKKLSRVGARLTAESAAYKTTATTVHRPHVSAILRETQEEDFLSSVQTDIVSRLTSISHLTIKTAMIPLNKVQMVDVTTGRPALLKQLAESAFTRLPVYEHTPANIIGFINIYQCLSVNQQFADLRSFIKQIRELSEKTTITEALDIMQSENQKIALVTRPGHAGRQRPVGIVTMKDLVEELLGELAEW